MDAPSDYLYYYWKNYSESWINEFNHLWSDSKLKGLTFEGWTANNSLPKKDSFNLEELMAAVDTIKCIFHSPVKGYKKINEDYTSYGLKGLLEDCLIEITKGRLNYVSNGTLILAMYHCGYNFKKIPRTPNCYFNLTESAVKRMVEIIEVNHYFNIHPEASIYVHKRK